MTDYFVTWKIFEDETNIERLEACNPGNAAGIVMERAMDRYMSEEELDNIGEDSRVMTVYDSRDGDLDAYETSEDDFVEILKKREPVGMFKCDFVPAHVNVKEFVMQPAT